MNTPDAFNPSKATDSQDQPKGAWMGLLGALAKSAISTIVKGRNGFLTPHRNCPSHPDQVTAMNTNSATIRIPERLGVSRTMERLSNNTMPAPAVPGFETLFGLIPLRPIDSISDRSTDLFEELLKRDLENCIKAEADYHQALQHLENVEKGL